MNDTLAQNGIWLGTDASYHEALVNIERMQADVASGAIKAFLDDEDEDTLPYNLSIQGKVGVVSIKGPLVNSDSPYVRYYGMTSYRDIRNAMITAAQMPEVEGIALDITSGGGAVSGLVDTSNLIKLTDSRLKPVMSYSDGAMASAAYWLGCSGRKTYCGPTTLVGSLGVLEVFADMTGYYEQKGIKHKILRAGKYKALTTGLEPLSAEAESAKLGQLQAVYDVFIAHVAERRGGSADVVHKTMADGREFIGQQALTVGLVDGVTSFDAFISSFGDMIENEARLTQSAFGNHMSQNMKKALTEQEIAALAAGAPLAAAAGTQAPQASAATAAPKGAPVQAQAEAPAGDTAPAAAAPAAAPAEQAPAQSASADFVSFLRTELRAAQDDGTKARLELGQAQAQVASLQAQLEQMQAHQNGLIAIGAQSLSNMRVALGGSPVAPTGMSAEALLAAHADAVAQFTSKFKAGGVAAAAAASHSTPASAPAKAAPAYSSARRAATGI